MEKAIGATIALEAVPASIDALMVRPFEGRPKAFPTTESAKEVAEIHSERAIR